jgi:hypothetical protein
MPASRSDEGNRLDASPAGGAPPAVEAWTEPWWINPRMPPAGRPPQARRAAREFGAMVGQICLVAWMIGVLAESACASRGWPPQGATAWDDAVHAWVADAPAPTASGQRLIAAP